MKEMWDKRYADVEYAYGEEPNNFLKSVLDEYKLGGEILFPAEGEGRNAVYAAKSGLRVTAFDMSIEGKKKAMKLADKEGVSIHYEVGDFFELNLIDKKFDAAALIFAHFPSNILSKYHTKIADMIKPGGILVLEGFSTGHLAYQKENPRIGGPTNIEMLFTKESIQNDFLDFEVIKLEEVVVELNEGKYHIGNGMVIRYIGKKTK